VKQYREGKVKRTPGGGGRQQIPNLQGSILRNIKKFLI